MPTSQPITLAKATSLLAGGERDAVSLAEEALGKAEASAGSFISLRRGAALAEAAASDRRRRAGGALGPLDGVPIAVKDLFDVEGTVTTSGSLTRQGTAAAASDAPVVAALKRQGVVIIGKTNLSEFAFSGLGLNPHYGTPVPDFAGPARIPGGSSSGSAVAVQRGIVAAALGTDTAGSIRVPAAFNGLAGFKSSMARYDRGGVQALAPSLDSLGPIAHNAADCLLLDQAMRGAAMAPAQPPALAGLRFVVDEAALGEDGIEDAVRANLLAAIERLAAAGATVERRPVPACAGVRALIAETGWLGAAEAWRQLGSIVTGPEGERVDRRVRARLLGAAKLDDDAVATMRRVQAALMREMGADLGDAFLVLPTVKHVAPELAAIEADDALFVRTNLATLSLTMIGSLLDMPGLALPSGHDDAGLPTSLLVSRPQGGDDAVLQAGLAVEAALGPGA